MIKALVSQIPPLESGDELVAEIAASTASLDLHDEKRVYRRNGVQESIV